MSVPNLALAMNTMSTEQLVLLQELKAEVTSDLRRHGSLMGLVGFELVGAVVLEFDSWRKQLRRPDGTLDREKTIAKYRSAVEVSFW